MDKKLFPRTTNTQTTQEAELELAFSKNPKKKLNYEKYKSYRRGDSVDFKPIRFDIETISRCNFACQMCTVSDWENGQRADDMHLERLKQIISNQYGVVEVKLTGLGEPMLQGDEYFEFVRLFREQHIWVRMVTNASLLHLNSNIEKLVESDVNDITISLDGASVTTFKTIRRKSNPQQVFRNMLDLNKAIAGKNLQLTKAWCCVQKENQHELKDIVSKAKELMFPEITFSLSLHGWGDEELLVTNKDRVRNNPLIVDSNMINDLVSFGQDIDIRVSFWDVSSKYSSNSPEGLCPWPYERLYISSDMRIVPCCMIGNPDRFELSRSPLKNSDELDQLWFGDIYSDFRKSHTLGNPPKVCANCYH